MNLITVLAAAALAGQPSPPATYPVFGIANATCRDWNVMKAEPAGRAVQAGFAAGFLTGANLVARRNVTGQSSRDRLLARIDRECLRSDLRNVKVVEILKALFAPAPRRS